DAVATDFPELDIVMSHAGYPWVLEAALLAWKYPNVYLEVAAHRPRYLATPGTGWEPLLRFGATTIKEKVLFGTGWFLLGRPPGHSKNTSFAAPRRCSATAPTLVAPASSASRTISATSSGVSLIPGINGAINTPAGTPASFSLRTASIRARGEGVWGSVSRQ